MENPNKCLRVRQTDRQTEYINCGDIIKYSIVKDKDTVDVGLGWGGALFEILILVMITSNYQHQEDFFSKSFYEKYTVLLQN